MANSIRRRTCGPQNFAFASGIFKPGHLVKLDSNGKLLKHATAGGWAAPLIALEDKKQGKLITDAFAVDDYVEYIHCYPGDVVQVRAPAAAPAIVIGDFLVSDGAGCFLKPTTNGTHTLYANTAASAAVSNTNSITAFDKSYTVPANTFQAGDVLHIVAQGILTSTNSTDTLTVTLKIGSTTIVAHLGPDATNNDIFQIDCYIVIRTIGASGTFVASGWSMNGPPATAEQISFFKASTTIDTTATQAITVSATWSAASASDSVRLDILDIELSRVNPQTPLAIADTALDNSAGIAEAFLDARML